MGVQSIGILIQDKPIFYSGEVVNAFCEIVSNEDVNLASFIVTLHGHSRVHWTETYSHSSSDGSGSHTETVTLTFEDSRPIMKIRQEIPVQNGILQSGRSNIPFAFQLPYDFATSFEGPDGYIRYWIEVSVPPEIFAVKIAGAVVRVLQHIDTNIPQYLFKVCGHDSKTVCCCCCAQGPVTIVAKTDRAAYCPGEEVALNAELINNSSREAKPYVKLVQKQILFAKENKKEITADFPLQPASVVDPHPSSSVSWNGVKFLLPPAAVIPSINSPLIQVTYYIEVGLSISRSRDLKVYLPIVIGTVPFNNSTPSVIVNKQITPISIFQGTSWSGKGGQEKGPPPTNAVPFELPANNAISSGQIMPQCFEEIVAVKPLLK